MLDEYSRYYSDASKLFSGYASSFSGAGFHAQSQALEVFCMMTISLCESQARAVSVLLANDCAVEPIIIIRSFFEVFCDFYWISQVSEISEQVERVFKLEGTPLREIAKELQIIERDVKGPKPYWRKKDYEQLKELLENTARRCPWLLNQPSPRPLDFKHAPDLASRIGPEIRLRFYHLYRFSSAFTHPTPMMKGVFLHESGSALSRNEIIEEPLQQFLAYGLWFLKLIFEFCQKVLSPYDTERAALRAQYYDSLCSIAEKGRKNYFSFREPEGGDAPPH
jgi:hypothetical protein